MDSDSHSSNENEPRRSRRLSTVIPASHWMSIGYLPREAEAMENLMKDMNRYCEREGGIDYNVDLGPRYLDIIPYHDMMLPLWKKFSKALMISTSEDVKELEFDRISMPPLSIIRSLSAAIDNHQHLRVVTLERCGLSNTSILRTFLAGCSGIQLIDLSYNEITSGGASVVADFIGNNHPVEKQVIRLANNNLSDEDMVVFASALKSNTHLFALDLSDNDLTEQGHRTIIKAVFDYSTSLNSLVDCNHTCLIWTLGDDVDENDILSLLESELITINGNLNEENDYGGEDLSGLLLLQPGCVKEKIRKKAILTLCKQNQELFDLGNLNDLMPRVLELIQEHTLTRLEEYKDDEQLEKDALSRLFHTLRAWHLPLLFDNLHGLPTRRSKRKRGGSSR